MGTRQGSTKVETRGLFKGAKVVRGCDWEWRDQDGGPNTEGVVKEITSWDDEATKDSVRVAWKKRKGTNIYRVGKHGKVCDLYLFKQEPLTPEFLFEYPKSFWPRGIPSLNQAIRPINCAVDCTPKVLKNFNNVSLDG